MSDNYNQWSTSGQEMATGNGPPPSETPNEGDPKQSILGSDVDATLMSLVGYHPPIDGADLFRRLETAVEAMSTSDFDSDDSIRLTDLADPNSKGYAAFIKTCVEGDKAHATEVVRAHDKKMQAVESAATRVEAHVDAFFEQKEEELTAQIRKLEAKRAMLKGLKTSASAPATRP